MSHQNNHQPPNYATDPNTMFVQADPSNFRNIVQKLTGAPPQELSSPSSPSSSKLPLTPKKQAFKLHERRQQQSSKKMELKLNNITNPNDPFSFLVSPVSHLDPFWARVSPHSAREDHHSSPIKEEPKALAKEGFYFLPSPRSNTEPTPELLPLFPLHSPNGTTTTNHRTRQDNNYY